jgi:NitT/TauT family transport system ATP-binding protein
MPSNVSPNSSESKIRLRELAIRYHTQSGPVLALDKTDLAVPGGEFLVLLGPSGCGKTTLLRAVAGLLEPSSGTVEIAGRSLWGPTGRDSAALSKLGVVFQEALLFPWYSIETNVALPLKLSGVPKADRLKRARELCALVGIAGFERAWPRQLSGGMRQRAAIARALAADPEILLMDEPFGALDAMTRDQLNLELQRIWMHTRSTVVFVTHSIPEAVFLADRIVLLSPRPGRIHSVVEVPFARPRAPSLSDDGEFHRIVRHLRTQLEHIE